MGFDGGVRAYLDHGGGLGGVLATPMDPTSPRTTWAFQSLSPLKDPTNWVNPKARQKLSSIAPSATGLMVWARRNGQLDILLAGLSHTDAEVRAACIRQILVHYYQGAGMALLEADAEAKKQHAHTINHLVSRLIDLANQYHWK